MIEMGKWDLMRINESLKKNLSELKQQCREEFGTIVSQQFKRPIVSYKNNSSFTSRFVSTGLYFIK